MSKPKATIQTPPNKRTANPFPRNTLLPQIKAQRLALANNIKCFLARVRPVYFNSRFKLTLTYTPFLISSELQIAILLNTESKRPGIKVKLAP
ncbi:MAG: hypothetical protein ACI808_000291 [Paraglaciecola sp.]|jgi:hypothetical protein